LLASRDGTGIESKRVLSAVNTYYSYPSSAARGRQFSTADGTWFISSFVCGMVVVANNGILRTVVNYTMVDQAHRAMSCCPALLSPTDAPSSSPTSAPSISVTSSEALRSGASHEIIKPIVCIRNAVILLSMLDLVPFYGRKRECI